MFPHRNIHKYTWTSPDGKTHYQIDHIFIDRRWCSSILLLRSLRRSASDTDRYLMVAKLRERWTVGKQVAQILSWKYYLRKINKLEFRKQYQIKISKNSAVLENLNDRKDINESWETLKRMAEP